MSVDENDAIEAFERLGLTSYEAKVFIALQRLGSGTARDVARIADVPRSQVYSVAERLENRGLLDVQQASPIRYRPVSLEKAQRTLEDRFDRECERALTYVEQVRNESTGEETQEDIWTVRGRERVDDRVVNLLSSADERIVFGTRLSELVVDPIERCLEEQANEGTAVVVMSQNDSVRNRLGSIEGVCTDAPPSHHEGDRRSGRIVIVDDDGVLLSVIDDDGGETAIWSSGSRFASVLIQLIEVSTQTPE
ncbi:TrmB family transcriptional regulator [Natrarchaeobius halalkaliphilus]|uniref:TrmB family transcriptional regulator n=1 Tax=Natrarchaeobius halalkaliphilus TaxID=1679091 RepID=A0A3N6LPR9_9EURY|nr:helix-turn-helix domain-containing protein [Natrarchaeobius halalkaliphilus]RQG90177.1 TrmB family transcriptional regulator [Natrarchaeobius halalkaliphilus]